MRRRRRRGLLADVSPAFRAEAIAARGAAAGPAVMPLAFREGWIELLYFGQVLGLLGRPGLRRHQTTHTQGMQAKASIRAHAWVLGLFGQVVPAVSVRQGLCLV